MARRDSYNSPQRMIHFIYGIYSRLSSTTESPEDDDSAQGGLAWRLQFVVDRRVIADYGGRPRSDNRRNHHCVPSVLRWISSPGLACCKASHNQTAIDGDMIPECIQTLYHAHHCTLLMNYPWMIQVRVKAVARTLLINSVRDYTINGLMDEITK